MGENTAGTVIIGAGQAGASCAAKLRALGYAEPITLIGQEPVPPYQRPPLSKKYLLGEMEKERLYLRPERFYAEQDITLVLGQEVRAIDRVAKSVVLGDQELAYDQLVLATGSQPRQLPKAIGGDLPGVYDVRNLADIDAMAPEFVSGRKVLVVGGGYIGLEAAAVAATRGLEVVVVEMAERILQRVAAAETSDFFRDLHQSHGVDIRESVGLERLTGAGRVTEATLSDGTTVAVDFVLVGIGIIPVDGLAAAAGLDLDNGIKTDAFGQSSDPAIWAAGDCASFPYRGGRIRLESVPNAIDQAELVAENIMGANREYIAKPWFWSDQYDVKLQIAGLNAGFDKVVTRKAGSACSVWYFKGKDLLAVDAMNDPRAYMIGKRLIEAERSADPAIIQDPDADLKTLL